MQAVLFILLLHMFYMSSAYALRVNAVSRGIGDD